MIVVVVVVVVFVARPTLAFYFLYYILCLRWILTQPDTSRTLFIVCVFVQEYELQRQLMLKLKCLGVNAAFCLRSEVRFRFLIIYVRTYRRQCRLLLWSMVYQ